MEKIRPKVGVGVVVRNGSKVLLGLRKKGSGGWGFPGGHLEFGEQIEDCAIRETLEETGVQIKNIQIWGFMNDIYPTNDLHYITIYAVCDYAGGDVKLMEPDKFEAWDWFDRNALPNPLFYPLENLINHGFHPYYEL